MAKPSGLASTASHNAVRSDRAKAKTKRLTSKPNVRIFTPLLPETKTEGVDLLTYRIASRRDRAKGKA